MAVIRDVILSEHVPLTIEDLEVIEEIGTRMYQANSRGAEVRFGPSEYQMWYKMARELKAKLRE